MGVRSHPTLGPGMPIDVAKLIESRLLIQANSGGGKSWAIRRLLEQTHAHVPQIVIDVEGEFHTLRERFDYVLAGQKGGDCPADVKSAAMLARRLLELNVSAIVDIYELGAARARFVRLFLESLVDAPRELWHPLIVVVDEAHMFCPEQDKAESTAAVIDLMTRGRKRGFCGVLATQRIASVAKSAAAECNNKLIGRSSLDIDMKRGGAELGFTARADFQRLRSMPVGTFYAFGPALCGEVRSFKVGSVQTTHPKAGQRAMPPTPPGAHVRKILAKLADLPREAADEARSVDELRARVRELERAAKEIEVIPERSIEKINKLADKLVAMYGVFQTSSGALSGELANEIQSLKSTLSNASRHAKAATMPVIAKPIAKPTRVISRPPVEGGPTKMERAMLTTLAQHPDGLSKSRALAQTGYSANGATSSAFARLVREGWTTPGGNPAITAAGLDALGPFEPLPIGDGLRTRLLNGDSQLSTMEKVILGNACHAFPSTIAKHDAQGDYSSNGATSSAFARLVKLGYLTKSGPGAVRAVEFLFGCAS